MTEFVRVWDASDKEYDLYDATTSVKYGTFTSLTGGTKQIAAIPYTVVGTNGNPLVRYLPGQVTYAPIKLVCAMSDVVKELSDWFDKAAAGDFNNLRRNCSITQYKKADDGSRTQLVIWDLINAMPVSLPGFSFNAYQRTSTTKFQIVLQAEDIIISYP